jgi:hypothetical protein
LAATLVTATATPTFNPLVTPDKATATPDKPTTTPDESTNKSSTTATLKVATPDKSTATATIKKATPDEPTATPVESTNKSSVTATINLAMEYTGFIDPQVNQNLIDESLITKDNLDGVEIELRFHIGKHLGDPSIHTMAFLNADALSNTTNFHF